MKKIKLSDINLLDVGHKYSLAGSVWSGGGRTFLALLPDASLPGELEVLEMDVSDWQKFIKQSDVLETEIFKNDNGGIKKVIVRKSQRLVDSHVQWQVFKRDNYHCRYCGRDGVNLTIDHIILWEEGGATVTENLLTACRKCNKERGRLQYEDWLKSEEYIEKSKNLDNLTIEKNKSILEKLKYLRTLKVSNIRSR